MSTSESSTPNIHETEYAFPREQLAEFMTGKAPPFFFGVVFFVFSFSGMKTPHDKRRRRLSPVMTF
jgi:hypothetical protein